MRSGRISWKRGAALALLLMLVVPILAACGGAAAPAATPPTAAPAAEAPTAAPAAAPTAAAAAPTTAEAPTAAPAEAPTAAPAGAPTAAPAAAGGAGGTLKILYWQAVTILNQYQTQGTKDVDASNLINEPLAYFGPDLKPIPYLAAEVPTAENGGIAKDATSVTWKLKPGIKWSDGSDFTADDVVFTWEYCSKSPSCTTPQNFEQIKTVEAVDPTTVKTTWKAPNANTFVSWVGVNILQKKQFAACVGDKAPTCEANNKPIGTGPYMLKEFKSGDVVTYDKNPMYRDAAKVAFDSVEIKGGGTAEGALRAVCETGETDFAWNMQIDPAIVKQVVGSGDKCTIVPYPGPNVERMYFNLANPDPALGDKRSEPDQKNPILSDPKVRQALSMAIDRKTIAEEAYGPAGSPSCNIVAAPDSLNSKNTKCDQDVEGAKKLLADAGWKDSDGDGVLDKDGKPFNLTYQTSINGVRQKVQQIVQANWGDIGVNVTLKAIDASVFFSADKGNPDTAAHNFVDIEMFTSSYDPDPTTFFDQWTCAQIAQKSNGWSTNNYNRYCDKDYDAMIDQLHKELDPAKRNDLFIKLNDKLVNDAVVVGLVVRTFPSAVVKGLVGPDGNPWSGDLYNIATWHK